MDAGLVKTLGLTAEMVSPLMVTVADGTKVIADSCCKEVQLEIQGNKFANDLRLFPLSNSDVILGVDWLRHHNPITFDYKQLLVKFQRDGKWISLQGDAKEGQLHTITGKKLSKLFRSSKGIAEGYLCMVTVTPVQQENGITE